MTNKIRQFGDVVIKVLTSKDIDVLCEFEKEARKTEPDIWLDEFKEDEYREKLESININKLENTKIVIAEQNGVIIGRCDIMISLSLFDFEKSGYIDWVYVLKDQRGKGIGKKLFRGAEEYFKSQGVKRYYLFTAENKQAQEFYHRQDFKFSKSEVAEKEL